MFHLKMLGIYKSIRSLKEDGDLEILTENCLKTKRSSKYHLLISTITSSSVSLIQREIQTIALLETQEIKYTKPVTFHKELKYFLITIHRCPLLPITLLQSM
jgi:hypothetical protein